MSKTVEQQVEEYVQLKAVWKQEEDGSRTFIGGAPKADTDWLTQAFQERDRIARDEERERMKKTTINTYQIEGELYFKKEDIRKLIKDEPLETVSNNRFDVPVNIGFK